MAISTRDVGAGVGGASLGIGGGEVMRRAVETGQLTPRQGAAAATIGAGIAGGVATADFIGLVDLPARLGPIIGGYGVGSAAWYAARSVDLAPRLVFNVPQEVNLADPLVTAFTLGVVGVAASTLLGIAS